MNTNVSVQDPYLVDFEDFSKETGSNGAVWLNDLRRDAIDVFSSRGFPSTKDEEWKYTSVEAIRKLAARIPPSVPAGAAEPFSLGDWDSEPLDFVNSRFVSDRLDTQNGQHSYVGSLAGAIAARKAWVEEHLARHADYRDHAFKALNTAFMRDGGAVYIAPGQSVDRPVHLRFVPAVGGSQAAIIHPRNLIVVGDGSRLTLVESYGGNSAGVHCSNAVTEIVVGENAAVDYYRLVLEPVRSFHVGTVQIHHASNSTCRSVVISAGGGLTRIEVNAVLDGAGAYAQLDGLYSATDAMHVDCRTLVEHRKPHTTSRELYKGILSGHAHGIFNGKVIVHKDAQKSDAQQANRNLLLSEGAVVDSKPQLEIFADDVRCSHGTTIGQLEEEELFYLRSRGLGLAQARQLLIHGFAGEILDGVGIDALRAHLAAVVLGEPGAV